MQTPYELLVRLATLPALHTNNGVRYNYATTEYAVSVMPTAAKIFSFFTTSLFYGSAG